MARKRECHYLLKYPQIDEMRNQSQRKARSHCSSSLPHRIVTNPQQMAIGNELSVYDQILQKAGYL